MVVILSALQKVPLECAIYKLQASNYFEAILRLKTSTERAGR